MAEGRAQLNLGACPTEHPPPQVWHRYRTSQVLDMARPADRVNSAHMFTLDDAWDVWSCTMRGVTRSVRSGYAVGNVSTIAEIPSMPPGPERPKATPQHPLRPPGILRQRLAAPAGQYRDVRLG